VAKGHDAIFATIRTEGSILPADLLRRLVDGDRDIAGLRPEDYHLARSERLNEASTRAWNRLQGAWEGFKDAMDALPESDAGTSLTREKWLLILFQELGYGRLTTRKAHEIEGKTYPISHEWQNTPIHLVSFRQDLDKRTPGRAGAARVSPHSLVQEFLNRSDDHLWGFVSNGLNLRLLRDNVSLTRQAYVEFDLQAMMDSEAYSDFFLLYLLCHQSRVEVPEGKGPAHCWLEKWYNTAAQQGVRALDQLRDGVQRSIEALGGGFLACPGNTALREKLRSGALSTQDYYRQVLRQVYRLLFLFVAEDRELLSDPNSPPGIRKLYLDHYSTQRLRSLAGKTRGTRHPDLWRALRLVLEKLHRGCPQLALPALGSYLFSVEATRDLNDQDIANKDLLKAIRALAFTVDRNVLRPVNYRNLGPEELGSVYESLLEMHPTIHIEATNPEDRFRLTVAAGSERKTTGSYYTPTSLVNCLLDSALDPVIAERLKQARELASKERASKGRMIYVNRILSRSEGVAESHGTGGDVLSPDQDVSQRGTLRNGFPDTQGGGIDSGRYRRGMGARNNERVHSVSPDSSGKHEGVGNTSDPVPAGGPGQAGDGGAHIESGGRNLSHDDFPDWFFAAQAEIGPDSLVPYSLLAEKALLSLKVCDPACGSGHFLIAAAHRIAKRLAAIRSGEDEPAPEHYQHALRDVIGHCIYGVDINPMSVELCKVSLWMEAMEPGKPLAFLDHRIKCGNSLLGATPALLKKGIPDNAFKPIEGDDKEFCKDYRKRNKEERRGSRSLFAPDGMPWEQLGDLGPALMEIDAFDDSTLDGLQRKEEAYSQFVRSSGYLFGKLLYDAWCAAFVWNKRHSDELPYPITQEILYRIRRNPHSCPPWMREEIVRLAREYQFFHWHLEFPDVFKPKAGDEITKDEVTGWSGGFDCVLGNPPWEAEELVEKEFFASAAPEIANINTKAKRTQLINRLKQSHPILFASWLKEKRAYAARIHLCKSSGVFPNGARGKLNTYRLFAELASEIANTKGRVAQILKTGIITAQDSQPLFQFWVRSQRVVSCHDFINTEKLFPDVVSNERFCLLVLSGRTRPTTAAEYAFGLTNPSQLSDSSRMLRISFDKLARINPDDLSIPPVSSLRDFELLSRIHLRHPTLRSESEDRNLWHLHYTQGHLNSASGSSLFRDCTLEQLLEYGGVLCRDQTIALGTNIYVPLYEGKFIGQMNHRFGTFHGVPAARRFGTKAEANTTRAKHLSDADYEITPRYWLREEEANSLYRKKETSFEWLFSFRDVCRAIVDARTVQACILPKRPCLDGCPLLVFESDAETASLSALFMNTLWASFVFDYAARQKIHGAHLTKAIVYQLPTPDPKTLRQRFLADTFESFIRPRGVELTVVTNSLLSLGHDCGYDGPPFVWNEERRFHIRCELDAAFFHLYLGTEDEWRDNGSSELLEYFPTPRYAVDYIMETFPIVKRRDEQAHGRYRTKDTILEIYDEMAEVMRQNAAAVAAGRQPTARYKSRLDPLPGPPMDAQGNFIPMTQWDRANWPSHIHLPREEAITRPEEVQVSMVTSKKEVSTTDLHVFILARALSKHIETGQVATFGSVKAEKIAHMVESHLGIDLGRNPARLAAGPADFPHLKKVLHRAEKLYAFRGEERSSGEGTVIISMNGIGKAIRRFNETFEKQKAAEIDRLIDLFIPMDTEQSEIVATLYAVWSDLLVKDNSPSKDQIIKEFYAWNPTKKRFPRERLEKALEWMETHGLVPSSRDNSLSTGGRRHA